MRLYNTLKIEISKVFCSRICLLSLGCLMIIVILHILFDVIPDERYIIGGEYPESVFNHWIGMRFSSAYPVAYYMTVTGLASLPAGFCYMTERRNSYMNQMIIRSGRSTLTIAKIAAYGVGSGVIAAVPLIIDYMITSSVLPSVRPISATFMYTIMGDDFLSHLFYTHPTIYIFVRIFIVACVTGLFSNLIFLSFKIISNDLAALIFPYALFIGSHIVMTFMNNMYGFSPYNIICPGMSDGVSLGSVMIVSGILLVAGIAFALVEVDRYEV